MKIDCKNYSDSTILQLLKSIPKYNQIIANAKTWSEVNNYLDDNFTMSESQKEYIKRKQFN